MKDFIIDNAFGILGILPDTGQKEITKKGKEIPKLIKFGDKPQYIYDFDFYSFNRNEASVIDSVNNLNSIRAHILHAFFRVCPISEQERKVILRIERLKNQDEKILLLQSNKTVKEHNRLIILLILLYQASQKKIHKKILDLLSPILENFLAKETLLKDFNKIYKSWDEFGIDEQIFKNLKKEVGSQLILIFSNIAELKKDEKILCFALKNLLPFLTSFTQIPQLKQLIQKVSQATDEIQNTSIDVIKNNPVKLKNTLEVVQSLFNKCIDMNIFNSTLFLDYRDKFCWILSGKTIDYYNETFDFERSIGLIKIAQSIGGSLSVNHKLNDSLNTLEEIKTQDAMPIVEFYLQKSSENPIFQIYNQKLQIHKKHWWGHVTKTEIPYDSIDGYSYEITSHFVNGWPDCVSYVLTLYADLSYYTYSFSLKGSIVGNEELTDFYSILGVMEKSVNPKIVKKINDRIFNLNENYFIGPLTINKFGITKQQFFTKKTLLWKNMKYKTYIQKGRLIILDEEGKVFEEVTLSVLNAAVISDLIADIISTGKYLKV